MLTDMDASDRTPKFAILLAAYIVGSILTDDIKKDISVLTCLRKTTRELQKAINQNIPAKTLQVNGEEMLVYAIDFLMSENYQYLQITGNEQELLFKMPKVLSDELNLRVKLAENQ